MPRALAPRFVRARPSCQRVRAHTRGAQALVGTVRARSHARGAAGRAIVTVLAEPGKALAKGVSTVSSEARLLKKMFLKLQE